MCGEADAIGIVRLEELRQPTSVRPALALVQAELASGRRLDAGSWKRLSAEEWWQRWRELRAGDGGSAPGTDPDAAWHRRQADAARQAGQAGAELFHATKLIESGAADWGHCARAAEIHASAGRWQEMADAMGRAIELSPRCRVFVGNAAGRPLSRLGQEIIRNPCVMFNERVIV